MDRLPDLDVTELSRTLDELLETEPTGEQGECPWCEVIRAPWAGSDVTDHRAWCPWARLEPIHRRLAAQP